MNEVAAVADGLLDRLATVDYGPSRSFIDPEVQRIVIARVAEAVVEARKRLHEAAEKGRVFSQAGEEDILVNLVGASLFSAGASYTMGNLPKKDE